MSSASSALPGQISFGSLLTRILFIFVLWVLLVAGTLHYVGYVWPTEYQISQAEKAQAEEKEQNALAPAPAPAAAANTAAPTSPASTAAAPATPAAPATTAVVAATPASTAAPAAPASSAAPAAASAPKATGEQKLPFDIRLAGYNRTALENVSVFFSIVISVFCVGAIILQVFQYRRTEA